MLKLESGYAKAGFPKLGQNLTALADLSEVSLLPISRFVYVDQVYIQVL